MNKKQRGFEIVNKLENPGNTKLPTRSDDRSSGYDFYLKEDVYILPSEMRMIWTDVKAYMQDNEVLYLFVRSSIGAKGLMLSNAVGVVDSSYYNNPSNDGNIGIKFYNYSNNAIFLKAGERVAQGVFMKYLTTDTDETLHVERTGGFGSSNR